MNEVPVKIYSNSGRIPVYAHEGDSCFDIEAFIPCNMILHPGERAVIPTGLYLELPLGFGVAIRPRSGMNARVMVSLLGTIDSNYRGEIKVILVNLNQSEVLIVRKGDRIAQGFLEPIYTAKFEAVSSIKDLAASNRGDAGFGSTGV